MAGTDTHSPHVILSNQESFSHSHLYTDTDTASTKENDSNEISGASAKKQPIARQATKRQYQPEVQRSPSVELKSGQPYQANFPRNI